MSQTEGTASAEALRQTCTGDVAEMVRRLVWLRMRERKRSRR